MYICICLNCLRYELHELHFLNFFVSKVLCMVPKFSLHEPYLMGLRLMILENLGNSEITHD